MKKFWEPIVWLPIEQFYGKKRISVLLFSSSWVHEDLCPNGVREGFLSDDEGWVSSIWDDESDTWIAVSESKPEYWAVMPGGPRISEQQET